MTRQKHILIIGNPISGGTNKDELYSNVATEIQNLKYTCEVFQTTGKNDLQLIEEIITRTNPQRVIVAGGDGTIQLVAALLQNFEIPLGIIPAGSANGLALNLELPATLNDQIKTALGDKLIDLNIINIGNHICIHIADLGINAELIRNYENSEIRGKLGYALQTIPTLIKTNYPFEFEIECNGKVFHHTAVLLAIANANKFGTGANINPVGKLDDDIFELIIFKNLSIVEIFKTLNDQSVANPEVVEVIATNEAIIRCNTPVAFQIDGEYVGEKTLVEARISRKKIKVAVGPLFVERLQEQKKNQTTDLNRN